VVHETIELGEKFTFTNRVIGNKVFMLLNLGIGPDKDEPTAAYIDGSRFSDELYYWKSQGKQIEVKINTPGGRVDHGWSIIDAIQECEANTFGAGIAYSMGGVCLIFGKHRRAYDYSLIMIHAPSGGSKQTLDLVKNQFRKLLETRTKFTKAEIDDMMDSGKDYFFTAEQAYKKGIIDEVVPSGKTLLPPTNATAKDLYAFYNNYIEEDKKTKFNMANIFASLFKKATEEEAITAVMEMRSENEQLKAKASQLETENKDLKAKLEKAENEAKAEATKTKAAELINNAEKAGKLKFKDAAEKAKAIESATANYDGFKILIDSTAAQKPVSAASHVADEKPEHNTYEWLAKNDPKKLAAIAESDPELFNKLSDDYIAKQQTEKK
jgi:ATP-dependent protease ClpP protease subunit